MKRHHIALCGLCGTILLIVLLGRSRLDGSAAEEERETNSSRQVRPLKAEESSRLASGRRKTVKLVVRIADRQMLVERLDGLLSRISDDRASFQIETPLGIQDLEQSIAEYPIGRKQPEFASMLEVVRLLEDSKGEQMKGGWIANYAAAQPAGFFSALNSHLLREEETASGAEALGEIDPEYAFNQIRGMELPESVKMAALQCVTAAWLKQNSTAASQAVRDLERSAPTVGEGCGQVVGKWLQSIGQSETAAEWIKQ